MSEKIIAIDYRTEKLREVFDNYAFSNQDFCTVIEKLADLGYEISIIKDPRDSGPSKAFLDRISNMAEVIFPSQAGFMLWRVMEELKLSYSLQTCENIVADLMKKNLGIFIKDHPFPYRVRLSTAKASADDCYVPGSGWMSMTHFMTLSEDLEDVVSKQAPSGTRLKLSFSSPR